MQMHLDMSVNSRQLHATPPASTADIKLASSDYNPPQSSHSVSPSPPPPPALDTGSKYSSRQHSTPATPPAEASCIPDAHSSSSHQQPNSAPITEGDDSMAARQQPQRQHDADGYPIPESLEDLVALIRQEMGTNGSLVPDSADRPSRQADIPRLQAMMRNYKSRRQDWERYAFFDAHRYTRNLIDDGNGEYNLLLLCWAPGQQSPIHDHGGSHCLLKVMSGAVTETLYDWPHAEDSVACNGTDGGSVRQRRPSAEELQQGCVSGGVVTCAESCLHVRRTAEMRVDQTDYINDSIGIHRVGNVAADVPAVTLHLYSPPIEVCSTFCERTGTQRKSGKCVFFSVGGKLLNWCESVTGGRISSSAKSLSDLCRGSSTGSLTVSCGAKPADQ